MILIINKQMIEKLIEIYNFYIENIKFLPGEKYFKNYFFKGKEKQFYKEQLKIMEKEQSANLKLIKENLNHTQLADIKKLINGTYEVKMIALTQQSSPLKLSNNQVIEIEPISIGKEIPFNGVAKIRTILILKTEKDLNEFIGLINYELVEKFNLTSEELKAVWQVVSKLIEEKIISENERDRTNITRRNKKNRGRIKK